MSQPTMRPDLDGAGVSRFSYRLKLIQGQEIRQEERPRIRLQV